MRLFAVASLLLCLSFAAESPKAETPKPPRTAPLDEKHLLKLENLSLQFQLAQRQMQDIQAENNRVRAEACAAAKFAKCDIDGQNKLVVEVVAK